MTAPVDISIVVVNWNAGAQLRECLESIVSNAPTGGWEIIVVDNASVDNSVELARQAVPGVRWILNRVNRGLAAANNQGIVGSTGSVVVLSNPDVHYTPGALDRFREVLAADPTVAFVVPRVTYPDGLLQTTAGDLPTLADALLGRSAQRRWRRRKGGGGFSWDGWSHAEPAIVGRAGDVCYGVRRAAIAEIGLLDERFRLDWEAIDWSSRAAAAGWRIAFSPHIEVVHHAGTCTYQTPILRYVAETHHGMFRYFAKRRPAWQRPGLAATFTARALLKIALMQAGVPLREAAQRPLARLGHSIASDSR